MYLRHLTINNFRAFKCITIDFNKGVNILIGENNSGKTAIIDALRICFGYGKSENNLYVKETDIHINSGDPNDKNSYIQFDMVFEIGDDPIEKQCFYDFISIDEEAKKETIQFHLRFIRIEKGKQKYFKREVWGGDNEHQNIPYEALQEIFYTYLDPLRDAVYGLKPYSYNNRTSVLFNELTAYTKGSESHKLTDDKKKELASDLYSVFNNEDKDWIHILSTGKGKVNEHLEGTGITSRYPEIEMNYVGRKYSDVVRGIELRRPIYKNVPDDKQQYFELFQNGLGENNLIYAAVVLGDLVNRCEDKELQIYNALLVEEPEAHLHPQFQNTFFRYLNTLKTKGLQVFITSHSPTITAKSEIENLIVLQKKEGSIIPFVFSNLKNEDYSTRNKRHLRKFLDTTKSQLFFANGVILVEGITEAILLPSLSKHYLKIDLEKLGVEVVCLNGVAFEHFGRLFNNEDIEKRMQCRCSIITDSDPQPDKPKSARAEKAEELASATYEHNLKVCLSPNTFEHDLFEASDVNKRLLRKIYRSMHGLTPELDGDFGVDILITKLKMNRDKGDFALEIKDVINGVSEIDLDESDNLKDFKVPTYLKDAINWVVNNE